jgi:mRNA interferase MazF
MIEAGDIVLLRFPQTELRIGKLRPALLLKALPGGFDDWVVCMSSSKMHQEIIGGSVRWRWRKTSSRTL